MGASARVAALQRARQRQARIEAATARTIRARGVLERALQARALAAERHDERVAKAEEASAAEIAELAQVCGTADAAAEILGWAVRDVRRVIKAEVERQAQVQDERQLRGRRRTGRVEPSARLDAGGNGDDG